MVKDIKPPIRIGQKFCVSCMRWMHALGGKDIISEDKLTFRWKCIKCLGTNHGKEISNK